jgi:hypothetical protein
MRSLAGLSFAAVVGFDALLCMTIIPGLARGVYDVRRDGVVILRAVPTGAAGEIVFVTEGDCEGTFVIAPSTPDSVAVPSRVAVD